MGTRAGNPAAHVGVFLPTFSNEKFVVPICTAMGFAFVLNRTGCERHLVVPLMRAAGYSTATIGASLLLRL